MNILFKRKLAFSFAAMATAALIGCGGGGAGDSANLATISGNVTKGPTSGATICAFIANSDGSKGSSLGCTVSKSDSSFSLAANYTGDILIEASGGSYIDEATGFNVTLPMTLSAVAAVKNGKAVQVQLTPLTTLGLNQLKNSGAVNATNYKNTLAALVISLKAKGVLPASTSINLLEDAPVVTGANKNAYGQALIGVARLMRAGVSLPTIVSPANSAATFTQLATASSTVLNNAQAQLVLTGSTVSALTSSTPLCSKEYDKRWAPYYLGMLLITPGPSANAIYSASLEDGTGSGYSSTSGVPIGGLCYEVNVNYQNIGGALPQILGTGLSYIANIAAYSGSTKTALNATDVRCLEDHPNPPYIISDIPWPSNSNITGLNTVREYFQTTEWMDVPTPPVPVACPTGQICATASTTITYTFPLAGGPYGQLGQSCWKKDSVWKFN